MSGAPRREPGRFGLQTAYISRNPNILLIGVDIGSTGYAVFPDGSNSFAHLARSVGPGGHLIFNPWWHLDDGASWDERLRAWQALATDYPEVGLHVFCNAPDEVERVRRRGLNARLINHNIYANESVFDLPPGSPPKRYRAVYNGKMIDFKRHALARQVSGLALIYSKYGDFDTYFNDVRTALPDAMFLNGDPRNGTYIMFEPRQVAETLGTCQVGLCLSHKEGAMYSSIEYMLCGLPVVSTVSLGGRDVFFDDRHCRIVADDPSAIAAAVDALIQADIPAADIRARTLEKLERGRADFVAFIDELQVGAGQAPGGRATFAAMMTAPWCCWTYRILADVERYFQPTAKEAPDPSDQAVMLAAP